MDPITIALVAVVALVIIIISLVAFKSFAKETSFEEAYGASALRLLSEEKASKSKVVKQKNKAKSGDKKKEIPEKETQKSEKKVEEQTVESSEMTLSTEEPKATEPLLVDTKPAKKKKSKHQAEEVKYAEAQTYENEKENEPVVEKMEVVAEQHPVESKPIIPQETAEHVIEGPDKKSKKRKARRADEEHPKEEVSLVITESKIEEQPLSISPTKAEKPKPAKPVISVKDINPDKLHTRLSSIEDLEPEYLSFLANYFSDTGALKTKLSDENATLRKQVGEKERIIIQFTEKLTAAQNKEAEIAKLQVTLSEEKKKAGMLEQSLRSQLTANMQEKKYLQHRYDQAKAETAAVQEELKKRPPPVDTSAFQQQIELLKTELNSAKTRTSQVEAKLGQSLGTIQQLQSDLQNRERQLEHLSQTNAVNEKRLLEAENSAKTERQALEGKVQNAMKLVEELQVNTSNMESIQMAANEEKGHILQLQQQLADTEKENEEINANYRSQLADLENNVGKLNSQLESLQQKLGAIIQENENLKNEDVVRASKVDQIEAERNRLDEQLADLQKKLDEAVQEKEILVSGNLVQQATINELRSGHEKVLEKFKADLDVLRKVNEQQADSAESVARVSEENETNKALVSSLREELSYAQNQLENITSKMSEDLKKANEEVEGLRAENKCAHCAARINRNQSSTSGTNFRLLESFSPARSNPLVVTSTPARVLDSGDAVHADLNKRVGEVDTNDEGRIFAHFELAWIVPDWEAEDAPKEVLVSGSFWGWQQPRPMNRTKLGYCLQVELPLSCDDDGSKNGSPTQYAKSDSGRGSPMAGPSTLQPHEFKFVVDGVWRCADHYAKKRSEDGTYENNVVYY